MNNVVLVGNIVRDPMVSYSAGENAMCVARFTVATQRRFKDAEGNYQADFISCVAFGKTGEFIEKYFKKGMKISLSGRIQTGSYTNKDGATVYTTDVVAENVEFVEKKANSDGAATGGAGFVDVSDDAGSLPFN